MNINDLRKDLEIMVNGQPHVVLDFNLIEPVKIKSRQAPPFARVTIKNIDTREVNHCTYQQHEKIELADVEHRQLQFSYPEGADFVFFDAGTGEQITVSGDKIANASRWLTLDMNFEVIMYKGRAIGVKTPSHVVLEVVDTGTASGATKPATLSTGAVVNVPLFVQQGEWVKVDTRDDGIYVERVNQQ